MYILSFLPLHCLFVNLFRNVQSTWMSGDDIVHVPPWTSVGWHWAHHTWFHWRQGHLEVAPMHLSQWRKSWSRLCVCLWRCCQHSGNGLGSRCLLFKLENVIKRSHSLFLVSSYTWRPRCHFRMSADEKVFAHFYKVFAHRKILKGPVWILFTY